MHDGDVGCEPILPAEPCPAGRMAAPGDVACRPVMECAPGRWGDIPVEPNTQYVDAAYADGGSDGSDGKPWTTITQANAEAAPGAIIARVGSTSGPAPSLEVFSTSLRRALGCAKGRDSLRWLPWRPQTRACRPPEALARPVSSATRRSDALRAASGAGRVRGGSRPGGLASQARFGGAAADHS